MDGPRWEAKSAKRHLGGVNCSKVKLYVKLQVYEYKRVQVTKWLGYLHCYESTDYNTARLQSRQVTSYTVTKHDTRTAKEYAELRPSVQATGVCMGMLKVQTYTCANAQSVHVLEWAGERRSTEYVVAL